MYKAAGKLKDRRALITGGDSGIGRSIAVLFAMEGADSFIVYLPEEEKDAQETKKLVEKKGRKCYLYSTDLKDQKNCKSESLHLACMQFYCWPLEILHEGSLWSSSLHTQNACSRMQDLRCLLIIWGMVATFCGCSLAASGHRDCDGNKDASKPHRKLQKTGLVELSFPFA